MTTILPLLAWIASHPAATLGIAVIAVVSLVMFASAVLPLFVDDGRAADIVKWG